VDTAQTSRLSGRRGQAARNDELILAAAREVFIADPGAPISAVAARAGVGISALYRRYPSKDELLREVARDGLRRYVAIAEAAVAADVDPWMAFETFMRRIVDADVHSLTVHLAGAFTPTDDMWPDVRRAAELNEHLVARTRAEAASAPTSRSLTCPSSSSSWPRSAPACSATSGEPGSSASATSR
jgi:AcrR family transcriptional regulator